MDVAPAGWPRPFPQSDWRRLRVRSADGRGGVFAHHRALPGRRPYATRPWGSVEHAAGSRSRRMETRVPPHPNPVAHAAAHFRAHDRCSRFECKILVLDTQLVEPE